MNNVLLLQNKDIKSLRSCSNTQIIELGDDLKGLPYEDNCFKGVAWQPKKMKKLFSNS